MNSKSTSRWRQIILWRHYRANTRSGGRNRYANQLSIMYHLYHKQIIIYATNMCKENWSNRGPGLEQKEDWQLHLTASHVRDRGLGQPVYQYSSNSDRLCSAQCIQQRHWFYGAVVFCSFDRSTFPTPAQQPVSRSEFCPLLNHIYIPGGFFSLFFFLHLVVINFESMVTFRYILLHTAHKNLHC